MGLKVSDFDLNELRGKEILEMRIDPQNESTIKVANKDGSTFRRRIPAPLVKMLDWYCNSEAA